MAEAENKVILGTDQVLQTLPSRGTKGHKEMGF